METGEGSIKSEPVSPDRETGDLHPSRPPPHLTLMRPASVGQDQAGDVSEDTTIKDMDTGQTKRSRLIPEVWARC